jgi:lysophospholipase L1-like esterase
MQSRKLPIWKTILFALIPTLLLFGAIEGISRVIWSYMEREAQNQDPNKVINYSRIFDPVVGYRLKPNIETPEGMFTHSIGRITLKFPVHMHTNAGGFMQREDVAPEKKPDSLRILTIGESTTQGHHVDQNYPSVLRQLLQRNSGYPGGIEVINSGVAGWISDQWALEAELRLSAYRPDIVIFYAGWNDFQTYAPQFPPPATSWFKSAYGYLPGAASWLKSVTLLGALWSKLETDISQSQADPLRANDHNPDIGGLLAHGNTRELRQAIVSLKAKRDRYVEKLTALEAEPSKDLEKIADRKSAILGFDDDLQKLTARLAQVPATSLAGYDPLLVYKFYLENLDRAAAAFQRQNPKVKIVLSTLVGRWPYESEAYFTEGNNAVWWMKEDHDSSQDAALYLARFNDLIRSHSREQGWALIDNALLFANVSREEIMWDFAHFTDVGYRMLGENMYRGLMDQGLVH